MCQGRDLFPAPQHIRFLWGWMCIFQRKMHQTSNVPFDAEPSAPFFLKERGYGIEHAASRFLGYARGSALRANACFYHRPAGLCNGEPLQICSDWNAIRASFPAELITHSCPAPPFAACRPRFSVNAFCDERLREEQKGFYESGTLTKLSYLGTMEGLKRKRLKAVPKRGKHAERRVVACLLFSTALD